ncbi:MAG: hypothetical protein WAJ88_05065 [Pseudolabrys sp.]
MISTPIATLMSSVVKKRFSMSSTPFTLQSRTIHATEKFVGVGYLRPAPGRQLTLHGRDLINLAPGRPFPLKEKAGQTEPGHFANSRFEPLGTASNYSVAVTDAAGVLADWPASAGRFAQAEKTNAAAQATIRTIRI